MHYPAIISATFVDRPNRFIAYILIDGVQQICHVKNTGRCKELLIPGATVWCAVSDNPNRKTKYDLIAVQKGNRLINMDSQAPNIAAKSWLMGGGLGSISELKSEYTHGDSRYDFSFLKDGRRCFLEVKGVTLEREGVCAFPDAPTLRGTKHLNGLIRAAQDGFGAYVLFVIQMTDVKHFTPNDLTDPNFAYTLRNAAQNGVQLLAMDCSVTPDTMTIGKSVPIQLA